MTWWDVLAKVVGRRMGSYIGDSDGFTLRMFGDCNAIPQDLGRKLAKKEEGYGINIPFPGTT
jgi:hypothetical protein